MLEIKTHFVLGRGLSTACGQGAMHVDTTPYVRDVTCKSCLRTTQYKNARTAYYEKILQDSLSSSFSFRNMFKKVWNWIKGIFK